MVDFCFNPTCKKHLHYLREGRVVRVVTKSSDRLQIEHYWLCGECYQLHDFVFDGNGHVSLGARFHTFVHADDQPQPGAWVAA